MSIYYTVHIQRSAELARWLRAADDEVPPRVASITDGADGAPVYLVTAVQWCRAAGRSHIVTGTYG